MEKERATGGSKEGKKREERKEKECVYVFIERVCNTVSSERGWGGVDWVDLATVRPISSSAVWNGSLATVTCKAQPSTETYISGLRGFHLAGTPTPHQFLRLMNHVSSSVVKKILLWQGWTTNPRQLPPQLPSTTRWLASKDLCTLAFRRCPPEQTFNLWSCWWCTLFVSSLFNRISELIPFLLLRQYAEKAAC